MTDCVFFPEHILDLISEKLESSIDYLHFGAICNTWHSAMKFNLIKHITRTSRHHQVPMLLLPSQEKDTFNVYDIIHDKFLDLKALIPHTTRFNGSSNGWLITVNEDYTVTLQRPYFMAKHENTCASRSLRLNLPALFPNHPDVEGDDSDRPWQYNVMKGVITTDPLEDPNKCIILALFGAFYELAFIRYAKDTTWTKIGEEFDLIVDVLYYKNQVYAINYLGVLISFDFTDSENPTTKVITTEVLKRKIKGRKYEYKRYLVESYGELLQVLRYFDWTDKHHRYTKMFDVFKLDFGKRKWVRIESLGEVLLFLGDNSSISVLASNFIGCQSNCIYFTHDREFVDEDLPVPVHDLGMFEMGSKRFKMHFNIDSSVLRKMLRQPPIWIVPTIDLS